MYVGTATSALFTYIYHLGQGNSDVCISKYVCFSASYLFFTQLSGVLNVNLKWLVQFNRESASSSVMFLRCSVMPVQCNGSGMQGQ